MNHSHRDRVRTFQRSEEFLVKCRHTNNNCKPDRDPDNHDLLFVLNYSNNTHTAGVNRMESREYN